MPPQNFSDLVNIFLRLIKYLLPVIASLALLSFFWGLAKFIMNAGDTKGHEEGINLMKWGLIALFVMVSLTGIIKFVYSDIGFARTFGVPVLQQ